MTIDPAIATAISISIASLLAASAARKLASLRKFADVVRRYDLVPAALALPAGAIVAAVETGLSVGLLIPVVRAAAGVGAAALFAFYAVAIGVNLARGRASIDCGCSFGASGDRLSSALLYRNGALVFAALSAATPTSDRALGAVDFVAVILFVLTAAALYLTAETLRSNAVRFQRLERPR